MRVSILLLVSRPRGRWVALDLVEMNPQIATASLPLTVGTASSIVKQCLGLGSSDRGETDGKDTEK